MTGSIRPKTLSIFMLTMINVATIGSVKNWPVTAEYGLASIFYLLLASVIFFIPTALVAAELATSMPELGGIYVWVKRAFGHRFGFLASWLLWCQNIVWYPTALSFIAGGIAYIVNPDWAQSKYYTVALMLGIFWITTLSNLKGMKVSGWISSLGMILGTFIPGLFIIGLGIIWYATDKPMQISFSSDHFLPNLSHPTQLALFSSVILSLAGIEMPAVHAKDVVNPKKNYPKAILYSALIILGLSIPGVLAIAMIVPQKDINLYAGSLQAIHAFLNAYQLQSLTPLLAILITFGAIASVSTWIVGPTKALLAAAQGGDLPKMFSKTNEKGMPKTLLIFQAIVVSLLSLLFIFAPTLNQAYLMLNVIVAELYLLMYLIMFSAAIKLRYSAPEMERPFHIPGKNYGIWLIGIVGIVGCMFSIIMGFFPPDQIQIHNVTNYVIALFIGVLIFTIAPWIISRFQKKG